MGVNVEPQWVDPDHAVAGERERHALRNVAIQFPGVHIDSPVQAMVYLRDFAGGIECYRARSGPTASDERWVGVCHFQQFEDALALVAFERAVAMGEEAAKINLAHLLRFLERGVEGKGALETVRLELLNEYDRVFYFRILSVNEENNGNLRESLRSGEEAWRLVQGLPEYPLLAPSILAQLGVLHSRIGRAQRALWFLERAIRMTDGVEHTKARLRRTSVLNVLGRYREAGHELASLQSEGHPHNFLPELHIIRGDIAWSGNRLVDAAAAFDKCVEACGGMRVSYEELVAQLSLTAINVALGQTVIAERHLHRAAGLVSDKSDQLSVTFRKLHYAYATGAMAPADALDEFAALDTDFAEMGLLQEQAFAKLHRAAILEQVAGEGIRSTLEEVLPLAITLQNRTFLAREWAVLPRLRRYARLNFSSLLDEADGTLELHTLGQERIVMAGADVHLPLRRAPELLAYFMDRRTATFEDIWRDLFPGTKRRTAKSYFHQFRHQLQSRVSGLRIEFDRGSGAYRLASEVDILWDVADVRARRREGAVGPFLPSATSDWALTLDFEMEQFRSKG